MFKLWILMLICICLRVSHSQDLEWPNQYSVKILETSFHTGVIKTINAWYDSDCGLTRIDYYGGSVRKIYDFMNLTSYEIHPETTEEEKNKLFCTFFWTLKGGPPEGVLLPNNTGDYEQFGIENIGGLNVTIFKFFNNERTDKRNTLWATFNAEMNAWIPVKYEEYKYKILEGSLIEHKKLEYSDFENMVDHDVFNVDSYNCAEIINNNTFSDNTTIFTESDSETDQILEKQFNSFQAMYNKIYDGDEHHTRKQIFKNNLRLVTEINDQDLGYKLKINKFSDLTDNEKKMYRGHRRRREATPSEYEIPYNFSDADIASYVYDLPAKFDLRLEGVISPVRVQDSCGACWAFSTAAVVEGALARNNHTLYRLSEQALLDCAWGFGCLGCDGCEHNDAYKWIATHGIPTEAEYGPYMIENGYCRISEMRDLYTIRGFVKVRPNDANALKIAVVYDGPVSVALHISDAFYNYHHGIFSDSTCSNKTSDLDHEVVLVGYGKTEDNEEYWILRNSWGPHWGIDGYMYISMRDNICGITNMPTYVVL